MEARTQPKRRKLRGSKGGQMPFALIAVTLLLMGSICTTVCLNIERSEETADGIVGELKSIDDAIDDAESFMKSGLGNILSDLSKDTYSTLPERIENFDPMLDSWIADEFPLNDKGVTTNVIDYDFKLDVKTLKLSSGNEFSDGLERSYLKTTGTVTFSFVSSTGSTERTLQISADGTSALPLLIGNASKFELSSSGDASAMTQLMTYQLSALAQSRIANGYGALSQYGDKGTDKILTEKDVNEAFENSISILKTICFRTGYDDISVVDPAEMIVLNNGYYEIDVSALVAQTLRSIADLLIIRWCDLFFADSLIDILDKANDLLESAVEDVKKFCRSVLGSFGWNVGSDEYDVSNLIKDALNAYGFDAESKKNASIGKRTITVPAGEYGASGRYVPEFTIEIDPFSVNVLEWSGWTNFIADYRDTTNSFREIIKSTINSICVETANSYDTFFVKADEFDSTAFTDSFTKAVNSALEQSQLSLYDALTAKVHTNTVPDPKYAAMYGRMADSRSSVFKENTYSGMVMESVRSSILAHISEEDGTCSDITVFNEIYTNAYDQCGSIINEYTGIVNERLAMFEDVLTSMQGDSVSLMKMSLIKTGQLALSLEPVSDTIKSAADSLMNDTKEYLTTNIKCGLTELGSERSYTLYDQNNNQYEEFITVDDSYTSYVQITSPANNLSKNWHNIGLDNITLTPYVSVFSIRFIADFSYEAHSMSLIDKALGSYDSSFAGEFTVNTSFDIPCVSGWSLCGVSYQQSTDILNELWKYVLEGLEPLMAPLTEMFKLIQNMFEACNTAMIEIYAYKTKLIQDLYNIIEGPLTEISEFMSKGLVTYLAERIDSYDLGLANQKMTFNVMGFLMTVELRLASLQSSEKHLIKVTVEKEFGDTDFSAYVDVKSDQKNGVMVKFAGAVKSKDWSLDVAIDPLLKFGNKIVSATGHVRDVDFKISMPERVMYEEIEVAVSDIPGVGQVLSNIPTPFGKCSFDLGLNMKFNLPIATGLFINEFESNPEGDDSGNEWVELYNASFKDINLSGYMLVPGSNIAKSIIITGTTIPAMGKVVITFGTQSLKNDKSLLHAGESITLYDPEFNKVDSTPWKTDTYNDNRTWQRSYDGDSTWIFAESTKGGCNGSGVIKTDSVMKKLIVDNLKAAVKEAFYAKGDHLTSIEDIESLLQEIVKRFISKVINSIANIITSASIFIELAAGSFLGAAKGGLRIELEMNSDLIKDGLTWLLNQIPGISDFVNDPRCDDPAQILLEDIYLRTTFFGRIGAPKFLGKMKGTSITAGFSVAVNMCALCDVFGVDTGKWTVSMGIILEDIDASLLPTGLKSSADKKCDLWLIKADFSEH